MIVLYRNSNENNELYYAEIITDLELIEKGVSYIDVLENASLQEPHTSDWKHLHINSVGVEDIVCLYKNIDILKLHRGQYFI